MKMYKKNIFSFLAVLLASLTTWAQITTTPTKPNSNETIEIVFDAGKGNKALFGHEDDVYFHAGLITTNSADNKDWKFVKGNWGKADPEYQMENLGGDKYSLQINPQEFFDISSEVEVQQIALVFRDSKGEIVGKTAGETDFLIPLNGFTPKQKNTDTLLYIQREYLSHSVKDQKLSIQTTHGTYSFKFYNNQIIKTVFQKDSIIIADNSPVVIMPAEIIEAELIESGNVIFWLSGGLQLRITKNPFNVAYYYNQNLLFKEDIGFFEKNSSEGIEFELSENEAIYGTGERAVPMNRRGYKFDLYNRPDYNYGKNARNLNYTLPVVLSNKKYLLFIDNYQKATIDIGETEEDKMTFESIGGLQQYFVVAGESFEDISSSFTALVGRQPLPPRWALGNLQSRMAYRTQKEVEGIVDEMISNDFPLDAIILDFYWFGDSIKGYLGNLKWYEKNWPEPEKMIKDFKEKGVKTILITEPYIIDSSYWYVHTDTSQLLATDKNGQSYIMNDFYFGNAGLLDMFKQETKDWFWEQYQKQIEIGVAGWWGDLGEPETHPSDMFHINGKAEEVHNIYAHEWAAMLHDKYQEHYPETRLFHLNRSGATGTQRYSIFTWSGDVSRSWSGFQAQLPLMLNMSICGLGYSSSDLGGFALGEKDEELYTRWLQMGVFNPIFRPHGSGIPSEPIFFSDETQKIVRESIKLRYRLMPYIYNAAYENTTKGKPIVKPLFYYHSDDEKILDYSDAYYFGDEIIAAPIIEKGQQNKTVYLPKGYWYDFNTDSIYQGKQSHNLRVNINNIPAFIKAGSFIPMLENYQTTDKYPDNKLYIHYYPAIDATETYYSLFEDDGSHAKNIENNNYQIIEFRGKNDTDGMVISLKRNRYEYTNQQKDRRVVWVIHHVESIPQSVIINNEKIRVYNSISALKSKNIDAKWNQFKRIFTIDMPFDKDQIDIHIY